MIENSYSCRKNKGTLYAAKDIQKQINSITYGHKTDAYILKLDLQGFFISINKQILYNIIERVIRENYKNYEEKIGIGNNIIIIVNKNKNSQEIGYYDIQKDFEKILSKAGVLK